MRQLARCGWGVGDPLDVHAESVPQRGQGGGRPGRDRPIGRCRRELSAVGGQLGDGVAGRVDGHRHERDPIAQARLLRCARGVDDVGGVQLGRSPGTAS